MVAISLQQQLLLAPQVAARAHKNQRRKDGTPYIAHPVRVALRLNGSVLGDHGTRCQIVAMLHDVVEDTDVSFDDLRELGFDQEVLDGLDSVTKRPGEKYADFINRSKINDVGRLVKLADIADNLEDQSALDPDEAAFLKKRYLKAKKVLNDE